VTTAPAISPRAMAYGMKPSSQVVASSAVNRAMDPAPAGGVTPSGGDGGRCASAWKDSNSPQHNATSPDNARM